MPIPIIDIERSQMTLDQKIWEFLAQSPGMAFTLAEVMEGLGDEKPYVTTLAKTGGEFIVGLLVDAALESIRDDARLAYSRALLFLASQGKVQVHDYLGQSHYSVFARALTSG